MQIDIQNRTKNMQNTTFIVDISEIYVELTVESCEIRGLCDENLRNTRNT